MTNGKWKIKMPQNLSCIAYVKLAPEQLNCERITQSLSPIQQHHDWFSGNGVEVWRRLKRRSIRMGVGKMGGGRMGIVRMGVGRIGGYRIGDGRTLRTLTRVRLRLKSRVYGANRFGMNSGIETGSPNRQDGITTSRRLAELAPTP
jgi:hypothetical protein